MSQVQWSSVVGALLTSETAPSLFIVPSAISASQPAWWADPTASTLAPTGKALQPDPVLGAVAKGTSGACTGASIHPDDAVPVSFLGAQCGGHTQVKCGGLAVPQPASSAPSPVSSPAPRPKSLLPQPHRPR
eukprot:1159185-Pelagomonas_calceolata.AAC.15